MKNNTDPLKPSASLLVKLGSVAVHAEEFFSPHGHHFDKIAIEQLLKDVELGAWIVQMAAMAMLPVKRNKEPQ